MGLKLLYAVTWIHWGWRSLTFTSMPFTSTLPYRDWYLIHVWWSELWLFQIRDHVHSGRISNGKGECQSKSRKIHRINGKILCTVEHLSSTMFHVLLLPGGLEELNGERMGVKERKCWLRIKCRAWFITKSTILSYTFKTC